MTEISERYRSRADHFEAKLSAVGPEAWDRPSPCEDWDARGVVTHVVESTGHFLGYVDRQPQPDPTTEEDPLGAWVNARRCVEESLSGDLAVVEVETSQGKSTFAELVDRFLAFDLVVHSWDLAKAAGIDESIEEELVADTLVQAQTMASMGRRMGAFGEAVEVPDGADSQTRLLALLGRQR